MVHIIGPKDRKRQQELKDSGVPIINTTSHAKGHWSVGLSPFYLGPVSLYGSYVAKTMESGWQNSKVYKEHTDINGDPTPQYFEWAQNGWNNDRAIRYPMGKGAIPKYSYWDGKKLQYIDARKIIYVPLYVRCVLQSTAWNKLRQVRDENENIALWDFDGYDYISMGKTLVEVLNDPFRKMGHAFVLAMLLTMTKQHILRSLALESTPKVMMESLDFGEK